MTRLHAQRSNAHAYDDSLVVHDVSVAHDGTVLRPGDSVVPLVIRNGIRGMQQLVLYRGRELRFYAPWSDS